MFLVDKNFDNGTTRAALDMISLFIENGRFCRMKRGELKLIMWTILNSSYHMLAPGLRLLKNYIQVGRGMEVKDVQDFVWSLRPQIQKCLQSGPVKFKIDILNFLTALSKKVFKF